jgi:hypothetical protein|tara:strand:- start:14791 stop:15462 length:672 start_codon:yes stop_codon:yes gene_type:complete
MCFSASASFSAGAVLIVIGIAAIKKTKHPSQYLFASIPFIFGVQQISEGILWISLPNPDYIQTQKIFTFVFLLFAQVIWPIWTPIAILLLDKRSTRKRFQKILVSAGVLVGVYLAYCLIEYHVEAKIIGHHIVYQQDYPNYFKYFVIIFYALATIVPTFFSHIKSMWILGVTIVLAYFISAFFYDQYVLSVWCFFSSIISLSIYIIMTKLSKVHEQRLSNKSL